MAAAFLRIFEDQVRRRHGMEKTERLACFIWLLAVASPASGCRGGMKTEPLWSYDPHGYYADRDFTERSYFSKEAVLISSDDIFSLTRLDVGTGKVLWKVEPARWVLHPPGEFSPLYVIRNSEPEPDAHEPLAHFTPFKEVLRLDPETGNVEKTISIEAKGGRFPVYNAAFYYANETIYYAESTRTGAIDPETGSVLWEMPEPIGTLAGPLFLPGVVIAYNGTYNALRYGTGEVVFSLQGACCGILASPDGKHMYFRKGIEETGKFDEEGNVTGTYRGVPRAVSNAFLVVERTSGSGKEATDTLEAYRHGADEPHYRREARGDGAFFTAVAVYGQHLFFFSGEDDSLWHVDLETKRGSAISRISSKFVVSPDATGTAPAFLSDPPIYDHPYLFINDWVIKAMIVK